MMHDDFIRSLADEGFAEPATVRRETRGFVEMHTHPHDVKALVLEGELHIRTADAEQLYRVGDVFHVPAELPHSESYGPEGVTYLVGRKQVVERKSLGPD